jgi:hypothetical protein
LDFFDFFDLDFNVDVVGFLDVDVEGEDEEEDEDSSVVKAATTALSF